MKHSVTLPLRLPSVANKRMHHMAKAHLVAKQREAVQLALKVGNVPRAVPKMYVALTRIAPRPIKDEHDNLRMALKAVADEVAAWLGVDDSRIGWLYAQEKGPVGLRIVIEPGWARYLPPAERPEPFDEMFVTTRPSPLAPVTYKTENRGVERRPLRVASERPVTTMRDLALKATSSIVRNRKD